MTGLSQLEWAGSSEALPLKVCGSPIAGFRGSGYRPTAIHGTPTPLLYASGIYEQN
ncbi:hypothetical protein GCM10027098_37000 [Bowmanella dokdonensis]